VDFGDLNGKGRSHASRFPESRRAGKVLADLSAGSQNVVTRTRPKQNLVLASPFGFGASLCRGLQSRKTRHSGSAEPRRAKGCHICLACGPNPRSQGGE
jgi:hypothetical protein